MDTIGMLRRVLLSGTAAALLASSAPSAAVASGVWAVRVIGPGQRALVTWGTIGASHQATVSLNWRRRVRVDPDFDVVSLIAQRKAGGPGRILCQILHNGAVVKRASARGPYAVCSVSKTTGSGARTMPRQDT